MLEPLDTATADAQATVQPAGDVFAADIVEYTDLIDALRERKAELGMTDATMDQLTGLPEGYTTKLLGPAGNRGIGRHSFGPILTVLGLKLRAVADPDAIRQLQGRRTKRRTPIYMPKRFGTRALTRATPYVARAMGRAGGLKGGKIRMAQLSKEERSRLGRRAARARWRRAPAD